MRDDFDGLDAPTSSANTTAHSFGVSVLRSIALLVTAGLLTAQVGRADESTEVRVMFVGDTGTGEAPARAVQDVIGHTVDSAGASHLFLLGDNVYDDGEAKYIKSKFIDVYEPVMDRGATVHAALGNHDVRKCKGTPQRPVPRDAAAYVHSRICWAAAHLATPEFGYRNGRRYYVVKIPNAAFSLVDVFVLDSNTLGKKQTKLNNGTGADEAQIEWLDKVLAESSARWKVIAMHHPIYTPTRRKWYSFFFGLGRRGADPRLRMELEDVLVKHGVDVVFQGHQHLYARLRPQRGNIRYIVSGAGGQDPDTFEWDPQTVAREDRGAFNHFVYVRATGDRFEYCAIDDENMVRDGGVFAASDAAVDDEFQAGTCPLLD